MVLAKVVLVLVTLSSICVASMAQSSGISSNCQNSLVTLSPCLNYLTGNSSKPSSDCCTQLGSVVKSSPQCLCEVVNNVGSGIAASLNINQTQALDLPNVCDVKTPPLTSCSKVASPSGTPAVTSPTTTTTPPTSIASGSKTTPTQGESSDASTTKLPQITLLIAVFFVTSHALHFNAV